MRTVAMADRVGRSIGVHPFAWLTGPGEVFLTHSVAGQAGRAEHWHALCCRQARLSRVYTRTYLPLFYIQALAPSSATPSPSCLNDLPESHQ